MNIRSEIIYTVECDRRARRSNSPSFHRDMHRIIKSMLRAFEIAGFVTDVIYDSDSDTWRWTDCESGNEITLDCTIVW